MTVYRFSFNTKVLIVRPTLFFEFCNSPLISFIWFNSSKCTCLPNLPVRGLIKMEISILISILACLPRKNLSSSRRSSILRDLQNQEYRLQFRSPGHGWQKNKSKKNKGNCKTLCVSRKHKKALYSCTWLTALIMFLPSASTLTFFHYKRFLLDKRSVSIFFHQFEATQKFCEGFIEEFITVFLTYLKLAW